MTLLFTGGAARKQGEKRNCFSRNDFIRSTRFSWAVDSEEASL